METSSSQASSSSNESVSVGIGGHNNGTVINGDGNTQTDHGAIAAAGQIALKTIDVVNAQGERNLKSAMMTQQSIDKQLARNNNLAIELSKNSSREIGESYNKAMQFVEHYSRSDGADVAKTNMLTIGILAAAGVGAAYVFKKK